MSGWTKLFGSIVTSSVWIEPHPVLRVWVAMLALADANGIVEGSIPGFANLCRVTIPEMEEAILKFSSPDLYSRSPEAEGRRIESVPGGWRIINRNKYRDRNQDAPGSRAAYFREYRKNVAQRSAQQLNVARNTETEIEKETEKKLTTFDRLKQSFDLFWLRYPKKTGKQAALRAWIKAKNKPDIKIIFATLAEQKRSEQWLKNNGQYIPNPATWINQGRWDDEITTNLNQTIPIPKIFPPCPICKKETTQADIDKFGSCPACYKPLPPDKLKSLLSGIGKDVK